MERIRQRDGLKSDGVHVGKANPYLVFSELYPHLLNALRILALVDVVHRV